MKDNEKFQIAQAVARTVIDTLTRQDYVNVICARQSHWDEVGKWVYTRNDALGKFEIKTLNSNACVKMCSPLHANQLTT